MKRQSVEAQKAEVEFRRNLVKQEVEGKTTFDDRFYEEGSIENILMQRMKKTYEQMISLRESGVAISPYLEIGAERCQRSLVMENDLGATGAAVDISYEMLKSCDRYTELFKKDNPPFRICCDAYSLPFMSNSIPFVFCYQTLHHFPDPTPIVKEIHRVLSPAGHFFFTEEPYKNMLHINLYKKKAYAKNSLTESKMRRRLDRFFAQKTSDEIDYGVTENVEIPLGVWREALSVFEEKNIELKSFMHINSQLFTPKNIISFLLAYLFGGGVSGICRKSGVSVIREMSVQDLLICTSCIEEGRESKLDRKGRSFFCSRCGSAFPTVHSVAFLLPQNKLKQLYPELLPI